MTQQQVNLKAEVDFVLALRKIANPCWVTYHAEFHARPSTDCKNILKHDDRYSPKCNICIWIDAIIHTRFKFIGDKDGYWGLA